MTAITYLLLPISGVSGTADEVEAGAAADEVEAAAAADEVEDAAAAAAAADEVEATGGWTSSRDACLMASTGFPKQTGPAPASDRG